MEAEGGDFGAGRVRIVDPFINQACSRSTPILYSQPLLTDVSESHRRSWEASVTLARSIANIFCVKAMPWVAMNAIKTVRPAGDEIGRDPGRSEAGIKVRRPAAPACTDRRR
jgi:hypothetical protein